MFTKHSRGRLRPTRGLFALAISFACVGTVPWSDTRAQTQTLDIVQPVISASGRKLHNSCYRLNGSIGQPAPGYSHGNSYSLYAGFWATAPTTHLDEIYFNGFEAC